MNSLHSIAHPSKGDESHFTENMHCTWIFNGSLCISIIFPDCAYAQPEIPAYAKWGRLAVKEVESKYPNARIIDYFHEG